MTATPLTTMTPLTTATPLTTMTPLTTATPLITMTPLTTATPLTTVIPLTTTTRGSFEPNTQLTTTTPLTTATPLLPRHSTHTSYYTFLPLLHSQQRPGVALDPILDSQQLLHFSSATPLITTTELIPITQCKPMTGQYGKGAV